MDNILRRARWSPYLVGAAIGVLSWLTFGLIQKPLGTSTTFVHVAGTMEGMFWPGHVEGNEYLAKHIVTTGDAVRPIVNWQFALVAMLAVGAWIAARLSRSRFREEVPELWAWRFGLSRKRRYAAAFVGGAVMLFGARLADGCTSGHGISGGLQLAVSSWVFLASMFATGIGAAFLMYGKEGRARA